MLVSVFGKKLGMTQIFTKEGKVVPVTAINIGRWFVTQIKTERRDGYNALQLGLLKDRYNKDSLTENWLKNKKQFCLIFKEVNVDNDNIDVFKVGQQVGLDESAFAVDDKVKVTGKGKGKGFQGVMKRWGFAGGPGGHGSNFHRAPGSIGNICSQGKVIKGKKLPGQDGNRTVSIKNLKIIKLDKDNNVLFVKGAVPGKKDSLVCITRQG